MEIVNAVYELIPELPEDEKYGMRTQMARCAISIPANIAEGSAKKSEKDYARFIEISLVSAFELETHSLIVKQRSWVDGEKIEALLGMIKQEQRMLAGFMEKL